MVHGRAVMLISRHTVVVGVENVFQIVKVVLELGLNIIHLLGIPSLQICYLPEKVS